MTMDSEQRQELVDRYLNTDDPVREIVDDFGIHMARFYNILREEGVTPSRKRGRGRENETPPEEVAQAYLNEPETPVEEIAEELGMSVALLYRRLSEADVKKEDMRGSGRRNVSLPTEKIAEEYEGGASMTELGEKYGAHPKTIRSRLVEAGCEVEERGSQPISLPVEEIVGRYEDGEHLRQIAEDYPASHETIRKRLIEAGVNTNERYRVPKNIKHVPIHEVAKRHREGETLSELQDEYGVTPQTLSRKLKNNGYEVYNHGPSNSIVDLPVEKMAEEYREGASLSELERKYPACIMTIRRRLIKAGVEMRPPGRH